MSQTIQLKRTPTLANPPAALALGELAVGMNDTPPRMWVGTPGGVKPLGRGAYVGVTPPANAVLGDFWWDDVGAQLYVFDAANQWVIAINQPGGGGGGGAIASDTPSANPTVGTLWWDDSGGQLYVYNTADQWVVATNPGGAGGDGAGSRSAGGLEAKIAVLEARLAALESTRR